MAEVVPRHPAAGVANGSDAKTSLLSSSPPKQNVQTCEGIFFDYMNISFQAKLSSYIQCESVVGNSLYKVGCVGEFVTFFGNSCLHDGVQRRYQAGTIHSCHNCSHIT